MSKLALSSFPNTRIAVIETNYFQLHLHMFFIKHPVHRVPYFNKLDMGALVFCLNTVRSFYTAFPAYQKASSSAQVCFSLCMQRTSVFMASWKKSSNGSNHTFVKDTTSHISACELFLFSSILHEVVEYYATKDPQEWSFLDVTGGLAAMQQSDTNEFFHHDQIAVKVREFHISSFFQLSMYGMKNTTMLLSNEVSMHDRDAVDAEMQGLTERLEAEVLGSIFTGDEDNNTSLLLDYAFSFKPCLKGCSYLARGFHSQRWCLDQMHAAVGQEAEAQDGSEASTADEVEEGGDDGEEASVDEGSEDSQTAALVGEGIAKDFEGQIFLGRVTEYIPASQSNNGLDLWHVVYEDGDSEDLDELEMPPLLALYRELQQQAREETDAADDDIGVLSGDVDASSSGSSIHLDSGLPTGENSQVDITPDPLVGGSPSHGAHLDSGDTSSEDTGTIPLPSNNLIVEMEEGQEVVDGEGQCHWIPFHCFDTNSLGCLFFDPPFPPSNQSQANPSSETIHGEGLGEEEGGGGSQDSGSGLEDGMPPQTTAEDWEFLQELEQEASHTKQGNVVVFPHIKENSEFGNAHSQRAMLQLESSYSNYFPVPKCHAAPGTVVGAKVYTENIRQVQQDKVARLALSQSARFLGAVESLLAANYLSDENYSDQGLIQWVVNHISKLKYISNRAIEELKLNCDRMSVRFELTVSFPGGFRPSMTNLLGSTSPGGVHVVDCIYAVSSHLHSAVLIDMLQHNFDPIFRTFSNPQQKQWRQLLPTSKTSLVAHCELFHY